VGIAGLILWIVFVVAVVNNINHCIQFSKGTGVCGSGNFNTGTTGTGLNSGSLGNTGTSANSGTTGSTSNSGSTGVVSGPVFAFF
jgi:hypothetical protein